MVVTAASHCTALYKVTAGLDKRVTSLVAFNPAVSVNSGYLHQRDGGCGETNDQSIK